MRITLRHHNAHDGMILDYVYDAPALPRPGDIVIGELGDEWHVQGGTIVWDSDEVTTAYRYPIVPAQYFSNDELGD